METLGKTWGQGHRLCLCPFPLMSVLYNQQDLITVGKACLHTLFLLLKEAHLQPGGNGKLNSEEPRRQTESLIL